MEQQQFSTVIGSEDKILKLWVVQIFQCKIARDLAVPELDKKREADSIELQQ